jgi:hypothetical protein
MKTLTTEMPMRRQLIWCLILVAGLSASAKGQTFQGSFTGTVTDSTGAVMPGAMVTAIEQDKGLNRTAVTQSDAFVTNRSTNFPQNSRDLTAEKARSDFDFRHRLVLSYVYDWSSGRSVWKLQNSGLNYLIEGWQFSGVFTAQSGPAFTPVVSGDNSHADEQGVISGGNPTDRPNFTGSSFYPSPKTPNQYLSVSAFTPRAPYNLGNAKRNILVGPPLNAWDFSLIRESRLRESKMLKIRAEGFNIINHAIFDTPQRDVASSSFGQIFNTIRLLAGPASGGLGEPRECQFALKLIWQT